MSNVLELLSDTLSVALKFCIFDPEDSLAKARIQGSALAPEELLRVLALAERADAWRRLLLAPPDAVRDKWSAIEEWKRWCTSGWADIVVDGSKINALCGLLK